MSKRETLALLGVLFVSGLAMAQQDTTANSGSWSGTIINSGCTADEAFDEAAKCTDNLPGAKLVLYDDTIRQIYDLDPQTQAAGHLGRHRHGARGPRRQYNPRRLPRTPHFDWARRRTESARIFCSRPVRPGTDPGHSERSRRDGSSLFPFRRLVTLLQRAAGPAAKRQSKIREAGNQSSRPSAMTAKRY